MIVCETQRLRLRHLSPVDAPFILELLNDPEFIRNIGDRQVRTLDDARLYILDGPVASYEHSGFGLYRVEMKDTSVPIGICGLLKRDYLEDVDVGFALLAPFRGAGFAFEAAAAVLRLGRETLGLERIVAITAPDNDGSIKVLRRLGLEFERMIRVPGEDRDTRLFTPGAPESVNSEDAQDEEQARAEQSRPEQHAHRQREDPCENDVPHGVTLDARAVRHHRSEAQRDGLRARGR
jgi:[ribosomal protein S5]-alanine N-acetyltransferase